MNAAPDRALPILDYAVIGVGATGLSCARYLQRQGNSFAICDTRSNPPGAVKVLREFAGVDAYFGELPLPVLKRSKRLLVSPGISLETPVVKEAIEQGIELSSDLDLFCAEISCPVVCITGSNGKSTVATLLAEMAKAAGIRVCLCGNIGLPVLDAIDDSIELYVVEVSSFQLERSAALNANAAVILNISPDHMDRYPDLASYKNAKQRIYLNADKCVVNRDDLHTQVDHREAFSSFGLSEPAANHFGVKVCAGETQLMHGDKALLPSTAMRLRGTHNISNALAALALADAVGIPLRAACKVLTTFAGLPHRCEHVADINGRAFINDSKGTNVGATIAALEGLGVVGEQHTVLIAGGEGKGADFTELATAVAAHAHSVVVFGADAEQISNAISEHAPVYHCDDLSNAVSQAYKLSMPGDTVLFSPACASFDMFDNFEHRGDCFREAVLALQVSTSGTEAGGAM